MQVPSESGAAGRVLFSETEDMNAKCQRLFSPIFSVLALLRTFPHASVSPRAPPRRLPVLAFVRVEVSFSPSRFRSAHSIFSVAPARRIISPRLLLTHTSPLPLPLSVRTSSLSRSMSSLTKWWDHRTNPLSPTYYHSPRSLLRNRTRVFCPGTR